MRRIGAKQRARLAQRVYIGFYRPAHFVRRACAQSLRPFDSRAIRFSVSGNFCQPAKIPSFAAKIIFPFLADEQDRVAGLEIWVCDTFQVNPRAPKLGTVIRVIFGLIEFHSTRAAIFSMVSKGLRLFRRDRECFERRVPSR